MEMLVHAKFHKPDRMSNKEFFGVWRQEAVEALQAVKAGIIKNIWKVPGKYEVYLVLEVQSVDQMDEIMHSLPFWRLGYDYAVDMEWTPLRSYENWAKQLEALSAG
jgi:muconolactone delta-isomerase